MRSNEVFFCSVPEMQLACERAHFLPSSVLAVLTPARLTSGAQKNELPALPPLAMSPLRDNITSRMRDRSLPLADTDLVKSHVEQTRIHLLGLDFIFCSSSSDAAWF